MAGLATRLDVPEATGVKGLVAPLTLIVAGACTHSGDAGVISRADPVSRRAPSSAVDRAAEGESAPRWWHGSVFYEVFVRSFADSDGDGVGDLRGLIAHLDYLNDGDPATRTDLGVDGLWLMPIHPSPSYHGYDVVDYRGVNPDYGTLEDVRTLIEQAHARGIKVIIDFVLNHSSSEHPWFLDSKSGPGAERRDWYVWRDHPDPRFKRPWDGSPNIWHDGGTGYYYGLFWSGMPDLNLAHPPVEAEMVDSMKHWLDLGLDGFRVDAVRYLIEEDTGATADTRSTHAISRRIHRAVTAEHPKALLVAEAWTGPEEVAPYYGRSGDEYQLAFGFDVASAIMTAAKDGLRVSINRAIDTLLDVYPTPRFVAPFLTNHDMPRAMRQLSGSGEDAARPAAATLFALPGTPFIYYGEEIGMRGGPTRADEDKRTPMRWTEQGPGFGFTSNAAPWRVDDEPAGTSVESQREAPSSLWTLYRDLIELRREHPALGPGGLEAVRIEGGGRGVAAFARTFEDERVLFVVNFNEEASEAFVIAGDEKGEVLFGEGLDSPPKRRQGGLRFGGLGGRGFAFVR